jgi:hypothetical protein
MRSRAARWTFVTVAWIAIVAAAAFLFTTHKQIAAAADAARAVDLHAREADAALAEARVAQQAYVATGQGVQFWMPKVASTTEATTDALKAVRESATSAAAKGEIDEATAAMHDFAEVDKRARDYIHAGQTLMAGDVIYTEGSQAIASAMRHVEMARQAERQAFDASEASLEKNEAIAIASAAGLAGLVLLLLAPAAASEEGDPALHIGSPTPMTSRVGSTLGIDSDEGIVSHARPASTQAAAPAPGIRPPTPPAHARSPIVLKAAADLATDFGRVRDAEELGRLLERAAEIIDASGLVVWMGDTTGGDLRAVLSHGYPPDVLARMPSVPRGADNAAATAYRTGAMQIVPQRPGTKAGAIVAPILAAEGCIGALAAEINDGGEGSEAVQAVSTIVAAHLASALAGASIESQAIPETRAAAAQR